MSPVMTPSFVLPAIEWVKIKWCDVIAARPGIPKLLQIDRTDVASPLILIVRPIRRISIRLDSWYFFKVQVRRIRS